MMKQYSFDSYPDNYLLYTDTGVNTLGVSVSKYDELADDYRTIYERRLSGFCLTCGSVHALVSVGFDDALAREIVANLEFAECECED